MLERFKRWRRVGGFGLISAVVLWVGYIAATRWNGRPARPARPATTQPTIDDLVFAFPLDPALDRSEALTAALSALPALPNLALPTPPEGMEWDKQPTRPIWPNDVVLGPWTPASRPNLQGVIDYMDQPATAAALERLALIPSGMVRLPYETVFSLDEAAHLLIARARRHQAEGDDIQAAQADLAAACRLGRLLLESGEGMHFFTGIRILSDADTEMRRMAFERRLTRAQAGRARRLMQASCVAPERIYQIAGDLWHAQTQRSLDSAYTKDANGNGWLVLSEMYEVTQGVAADSTRSGAWNVCSVFFNDRKTVQQKLLRLYKATEGSEGLTRNDAINALAREFSFLDGPLAYDAAPNVTWSTATILNHLAGREAAVAATALSAYRNEHGAWPAELKALKGEYLESLPRDPYGDGPLRYRHPADEDTYLLYSIAGDGKDDGGAEPKGRQVTWIFGYDGDLSFEMTRPSARAEPRLIEAAK